MVYLLKIIISLYRYKENKFILLEEDGSKIVGGKKINFKVIKG